MPDVRTTEREVAGQISGWFNKFIEAGGYPFESTSVEPSLGNGRTPLFPDIQIWLNREAKQGFCGIELKSPDVAVDDAALLKNAAEKAARINANYFVTWNLRDTVIWRRPQRGAEVSSEYRLPPYPTIYQVTSFDDVWEDYTAGLLKARAQRLLNDLAILHREGHLHQIDTDSTFFVARLKKAVDDIAPLIRDGLKEKVGKDAKFRRGLETWAVQQAIPKYGDEPFYRTVSRQIAYRLLGRILFYQTLMRFWPNILSKIDFKGQDPATIEKTLREHFQEASRIDYQAVFEPDFIDQVPLPPLAGEKVAELVDNLNIFKFSSMPQDVVGRVFEQLIPYEERHALGQYFTPEDLVDLIVVFCVRTCDDLVLDPTCGSGTFLVRAYDRLRYFGQLDHRKLLSQLWGIDIAHFPAELATINLFRQNLAVYTNVPHIKAMDFFGVRPGDTLQFAPPKAVEDPNFTIKERLPAFDAAMGNFPYIRQELIERKVTGYKATLSRVIAEDWLAEYPGAFNLSREALKGLEHALKNQGDLSPIYDKADFKLSGQADIYAYLFFHTASHLKDGGRMGFVTSNAWLDVVYGYELQRFFLNNFKIVAILESRCEPWFEDPSGNTIVTILERCRNQEERDNNLVKFVKVKKRLKELIPWDMELEASDRWAGLNRDTSQIENAGSEHLQLVGEKYEVTLKGHATYEDDSFRIRVLKQGELREEVETAGKTVKWGRYLRAPEVYFEILKEAGHKLVPLEQEDVAEIRFGIKTGINEFFHVTEQRSKHWEIEEEFLVPIVTSLREIDKPVVEPANVKHQLFKCHQSKAELRKSGKRGTLAYIEHGEKQRTSGRGRVGRGGVRYPKVPSVQGRQYWFDVGDREPGDLIINRFVGERFFFPLNRYKVMVSDSFFESRFLDPKSAAFYQAVINSTMVYLFSELTGRITWTQGVLYFYGPEISKLLVPHSPHISAAFRRKIIRAFEGILSRPIHSIFDEAQMKDRQALDRLVLEALGLDPDKYLKRIYDGLTELVRERIELSKMRKKVRQIRTQRDIEKLKRQVVEEVLPAGPKPFPEQFLDPSLKKGDFVEVSIPGDPLKLGMYFMGRQEVVSDLGFRYDAKSVAEAKYLIYAQKPHSYLVKLPKAEPAMTKAVTDYERYLRELRGQLFKVLFDRAQEHAIADRLTNAVFEELGLLLLPPPP